MSISRWKSAREASWVEPILSRARERLVREFEDDPDDGVSASSQALIALEEVLAWMLKQGWAPKDGLHRRIEGTVECVDVRGMRHGGTDVSGTSRRMAMPAAMKLADVLPGYLGGDARDEESDLTRALFVLRDVLVFMGRELQWTQQLQGDAVDASILPAPALA